MVLRIILKLVCIILLVAVMICVWQNIEYHNILPEGNKWKSLLAWNALLLFIVMVALIIVLLLI